MTEMRFVRMDIPSAELGPESTLPMLYEVNDRDEPPRSALDDDDGLYLGYRFVKSAFPYRAQENYDRALNRDGVACVVLENDFLRATFVPGMGGKLWSLFDKKAERELLFANPVLRPAYLATRNAWCSGGVEWNCGIVGHTPFTCAPLFTATLRDADGTPVLRMYEFERIRGVTYQMDFSLPEGSPVLYARMRVVNPSYRDTAMYWWSNIAVPEIEGARLVVPADRSYTHIDGRMTTVPIPVRDGLDVTYPMNNPVSVDYFFKTDPRRRMYHCQLDRDGYGLFESSTARLKGRKLFVWGQGPGGEKWQEYLSGEGNPGRYVELQCGLAATQSECLPMPPATAWEWLEIYGALRADPAKVHGADWDAARAEVEARIGDIASAEALEERLIQSRETALRPAQTLISAGSGWGALENMCRAKDGLPPISAHLDFGKTGDAQAQWAHLLDEGVMPRPDPRDAPPSWMRQTEWLRRMEDAARGADHDNWYTFLQLGCAYLARVEMARAEQCLNESLRLCYTGWALYAMAELRRVRGEEMCAALMMAEASGLLPDNTSLARAAARALNRAGAYRAQMLFTAGVKEEIRRLPRIRLYRAFAAVKTGDIDLAETLLWEDGGLTVPDIQEGEVSLSEMWFLIEEAKAAREGRAFDRTAAQVPHIFDFRMNVARAAKKQR